MGGKIRAAWNNRRDSRLRAMWIDLCRVSPNRRVEMSKHDVSHYFWRGFHRRGWFSHRRRAKELSSIPMPYCGGPRAWRQTATAQSLSCLSPKLLLAALHTTSDHLDLLSETAQPSKEWLEANAPSGCVSPLGTFAAAEAFCEVRDAYTAKGFRAGVMLPFLSATLREGISLALILLFNFALPLAYPLACYLQGKELSGLLCFLLALFSFIAGDYARHCYERQL